MIDAYIPSLPISLYIHVPFCRKRCDYCAFYSSVIDDEVSTRYYSILKAELETIVEEIKRPFYTIYFGGGNPILLGIDRIKELLSIAARYGKAEECTVEVNPEDISSCLDNLYPQVNRISTGIQSMKDRTLLFLNRRARVCDNRKAMEYLSSSPFIWNADIITAVPTTLIDDTLYDIEEVRAYNPHHISFYCLTFEENTPLIKKAVPLGDEKEREFLLAGWNKLESLGYRHYEVSAFSRPGYECKHNSVYWELGQYIGLGPSAESFLGYTEGVSMRNTEDLTSFIKKHEFQCEKLNQRETEESFLITALRRDTGIDKTEYEKRFSSSFDSTYSERIGNLDNSWYINTPSSFFLTREGMMMLNSVILTLSLAL